MGPSSFSVGHLGRVASLLALVVALATAATARPAVAQFGPGPRALGTGGAFVGLARGFEAVYWNPANLALPDAPSSSFGLVHPAAAAAVLGPDIREFGILAESAPTATSQAAFLAAVPATGLKLRTDVTIPWVSFSAGAFGVGVASTALAEADASRDLLELYLDARDDGLLDGARLGSYRVGDTGYRDAAFTEVVAAYGMPLQIDGTPVTFGIGARAVVGHRLDRGRLFEPVVEMDHLVLSGIALRSGGGRGFGFDVGVSARPAQGLTVGVAVQNVFHRMRWDEDLQVLGGDVTTTELDEDGLETLLDRFEARPFDPTAAPLEAYEVARGFLTEAYQPRVLRAGAGYQRGGSSAGLTVSSTVGGGDLHAGWPRYIAVGVEQRLYLLELRAGYANSLSGASALTVGSGLRMGSVQLMASAARILGSGEPSATAEVTEGWRYADRLATGSGYALTLGLSVTSSSPRAPRGR